MDDAGSSSQDEAAATPTPDGRAPAGGATGGTHQLEAVVVEKDPPPSVPKPGSTPTAHEQTETV